MAVLVATPRGAGAARAALANHMQRSVNIFLGSVLSTIGLTVPAMILICRAIGRDIVLGVEHTDLVLLLVTLAVSVVTFASGRTNVIQGAVHLILFGAYLLLISRTERHIPAGRWEGAILVFDVLGEGSLTSMPVRRVGAKSGT